MQPFLTRFDAATRKQIETCLKRQVGFIMINMKYDKGIYDAKIGKLTLLEVTSGQSAFVLQREENLDVSLYHCSPSSGTRVSTVNLSNFQPSTIFRFDFLWSPNHFQLAIFADGRYVKGASSKPKFELQVGKDGAIYQLGDENVVVGDVMLRANGKMVLQSSAIKSWEESKEAISILQTGSSPVGYAYESFLSNQLISLMCSSFEIYGKRRFLELIDEGIEPNYPTLEKVFFTSYEREKGLMANDLARAKQKGHSLACELLEKRRIDFGNYQDCKDAFSKGYGLSFPDDLKVDGKVINTILQFIDYRHKIIHSSPMLGMLNIEEVPPKEPVFPTISLVNEGVKNFDLFIQGLHKATQKIAFAKETKP